MDINKFENSVYSLVVSAATKLPPDVAQAMKHAIIQEAPETQSAMALKTIAKNLHMAEELTGPICQDTGLPYFLVYCPVDANQLEMKSAIHNALIAATKNGKLRPNSVDSLTGENSGNNLGPCTPVIQFRQWKKPYIDVKLMLKGGGSENKSVQYTVPCELDGLGTAGRDLDGVRKCIMHAIYSAQGKGCSAGFIGVGIGGDRTASYEVAKDQLFRHLEDTNDSPMLQELEAYIVGKANELGIGTMGFGGKISLLGCKIGAVNRHPASFFVSIAYMCWANRRVGAEINAETGEISKWHYQTVEKEVDFSQYASKSFVDQVVTLQTPLTEEQVRSLKVGDVVRINGMVYTGRDAVHKHLATGGDCPIDLNGQIIYHCGPVMLQDETGEWHVKAAGPTTSIREEPYQGDVMKKFGIRAVIGKGGMGAATLDALQDFGGVYLNAIGGAAQFYADCIKSVEGVDLLELGVPEAIWHLKVEGFTAVVTMDAHGNSLHKDIDEVSFQELQKYAKKVF